MGREPATPCSFYIFEKSGPFEHPSSGVAQP
jgi:hypothetical protein